MYNKEYKFMLLKLYLNFIGTKVQFGVKIALYYESNIFIFIWLYVEYEQNANAFYSFLFWVK